MRKDFSILWQETFQKLNKAKSFLILRYHFLKINQPEVSKKMVSILHVLTIFENRPLNSAKLIICIMPKSKSKPPN